MKLISVKIHNQPYVFLASYLLIGAVGFKVAGEIKIKSVRDPMTRHLILGVGQLKFYFTARGWGRGKDLFAYPQGNYPRVFGTLVVLVSYVKGNTFT